MRHEVGFHSRDSLTLQELPYSFVDQMIQQVAAFLGECFQSLMRELVYAGAFSFIVVFLIHDLTSMPLATVRQYFIL